MRERGARIAKCYASEFSLEREATILVLEDLYPAEQGDQLHGCSIEDAELGIKQAARIHATFWGADSPILENVKWLTGRDKSAPTLIQMFTPVFIERYKSRMTPDMEALLTKFAPLASAWLEELSHGPRTVVHGDYRIDNLLFAPKDRDSADRYCYTVDWQTPALGRAGYDIGYFLGASLLPEERAKHEERLVKLYHDELVAQGVKDYPFDLLFKDYRKGQMAGMIMAVIASNVVVRTERGDEMFWTMFHRHYEAGKHVNVEELFPTI